MIRIAVALSISLALTSAAFGADDPLRRLTAGGRERSYLLHLPPIAGSGEPLPLVVVLHGAGGNAWAVRAQTGFSEEADWRGFAVAYPNGSDGGVTRPPMLRAPGSLVWNAGSCCGWASEHGVDDVAFLRAVVEDVARSVAIDRKRVFAAGMSNGGMMAYRLACEASDSFAAIGVVSGALVTPECAPVEPVSVIHLHGTADTIVPLAGGPGRPDPPGFYPSTASAISFWRAADECDSTVHESTPRKGVRVAQWPSCRDGSAIELYTLAGGKHAWPGGSRFVLPPESIPATAILWEFFASHPRE